MPIDWQAIDWQAATVVAAAISLLVLSTPGVRVVQASDDVASTNTGQVCEAPSSTTIVLDVDRMLERARSAKPGSADAAREGVVALNNSGYNYARQPAMPVPHDDR